jgi:hypothetical protein
MTLKQLIANLITGELEYKNYTIEQLLEIDLLNCNAQTLDELNDLFYKVSQACDDIYSYCD